MWLYKYLDFPKGENPPDQIKSIPGYAGTNLKQIYEFTQIKGAINRIVYKFKAPKLMQFPGDDTIIGFDWDPAIDNTWSNKKAYDYIKNWKPCEGLDGKEDTKKLVELSNAVWSYKPGWIARPDDPFLECDGESLVTIPCLMIKVTEQEIIAAYL